jgi:hypothetical protein
MLAIITLMKKNEFPTTGEMKKRVAKGSLKLYLQGAKLQGYFNLVKANDSDKEEWFFMKAPEKEEDIDYEQKSALTGRSMDEIAGSAAVWNSHKQKKETIQKESKPKELDTTYRNG